MTGPEHYKEAEALIGSTVKTPEGLIGTPPPHVIALAQVHATLALAAASADAYAADRHYTLWLEVLR